MITYICKNKDAEGENLPCTNNRCETSVCPTCGGRAEALSEIFWCSQCQVPLYEDYCSCCGAKAKKMTTDLRPVFPEERLLLEIILGEPFSFLKDSVWNGSGNNYYVNGKKIKFSVKELKNMDVEMVRQKYEAYKNENTYEYFNQYVNRFVECNKNV